MAKPPHQPPLPTIMRAPSARQMAVDAGLVGNRRGAESLKTNRGNSVDYVMTAGIIPQPLLIVRDSGESVAGDGLNWIVNWETPQSNQVNPNPGLFVKIEFGEGGAREAVFFEAYPGFVVQVPSTSIDVYIGSDTVPGVNETVRVKAQLHRSITSSQEADGHRSFVLNGAGASTTIIIPPFANDFIVLGDTNGAVGMFGGAATLTVEGKNIAAWGGPQLLANAKVGQRILLPGGATKVVAHADIQLQSALLDFGIGL
jgi:hypothetical protein